METNQEKTKEMIDSHYEMSAKIIFIGLIGMAIITMICILYKV